MRRDGTWERLLVGVVAVASVLGVAFVGGCRSARERPSGPAPSGSELAESYNRRVDGLSRVWARATVRVRGPDGQGGRRVDQGEGYLFYESPRRVGLLVGKYIDRMYFHLGSNDELFWWIDALDDEERVALVGSHEGATRADAERFGVPVHPLDLRELIGVTGIEQQGSAPGWERLGDRWVVEVVRPARWGRRRVMIDPATLHPVRVELWTEQGELAASSDLSRYRLVQRHMPGEPGYIAESIVIELPGIETRVEIDLADPVSDPSKPRDAAFDIRTLLRSYGIAADRVRVLGDDGISAATSPGS